MSAPTTGVADRSAAAELAAGSPVESRRTYRVGTLSYTAWGLASIFFWMLWGDFCFTLMELVIPSLLPLSLKDLGASNALIGLLVGTIPGFMNVVITPVVSFRSDRHRGRLGRRIPYLLWPTPLVSLFLVITGFADRIGLWLHAHAGSWLHVSPTAMIIGTVAVASIVFQYFHLLVASIYYYLFRDVVPEQFMGRFFGMFRVVSAGGAFIFDRWIFGWAGTHRYWIYVGAAVLYGSAFLLMCWRVKEGEYPPPPPKAPGGNPLQSVQTYFRECFTTRQYLYLYAAAFCYICSSVCQNTFAVFFAQKNLGLSLEDFGHVRSWTWVIAAAGSVPLGYLTDKLHPLRMTPIAVAVICSMTLSAFFLVHGATSFLVFTLLWTSGRAVYEVAIMPMLVAVLPAERFGQFCSANALCGAVGIMFGSYAAGRFLDLVDDYRFIYVWSAVFTGMSLMLLMLVYAQWRRRGGPEHYVAPLPGSEVRGFEVLPANAGAGET